MTANTGRPDLDRRLAVAHVPPGEPIFYLRARDPAAEAAIRAYAARALKEGAPLAVVEEALQHADRFRAWSGERRLPDVAHLDPHEIKQLEYQLGRRAWNSRPKMGHVALLAWRRGWDAAMAAVRAEVAR